MTRGDVLARYDPIRASIKRVLKLGGESCSKADWTRAMKHIANWADPAAFPEGEAWEMVTDIALFEPNQRGRRAFDTFLSGKAANGLSTPDVALAQRMAASAAFSIFRLAGRHEAAGLWLEDMLLGDRRLWLMDRSLEGSAPEGAVFGMRLFEAGAFHAGFGIIVPVDENTLDFCLSSVEDGRPLPFRHSLAATLYGAALGEVLPPSPGEIELAELLETALSALDPPDEPGPAVPSGRTGGRRREKKR